VSRAIIGIDPGTLCGWAVLDDGGSRLASGFWDLRPRRYEGAGMRFVRLRRYLGELLVGYSEAEVVLVYEEVRHHAGTDAAHIYGGIVAVLQEWCEGAKVPYDAVPVGTVKKQATGKGNAKKEEMVAAAVQRWALDPTEDEADALWIAETWRNAA
jgi:Holliday junction resolvasome RuvABC endonuclease subunit